MRNHSAFAPFWAAGGAASAALAQAAILALLARLGEVDDLGRYALAAAITAPVMLPARLQLRILATAQTDSSRPPGVFLRTRLLVSGTAAVGLALFAWLLFEPLLAASVALLAASRLAEDLAELSWGWLQREHRWRLIAGSQAAHAFGLALVFGVTYAASLHLPTAIAAGAAWHFVVFLAFDLPSSGLWRMDGGEADTTPWSHARALVREAGWLGPTAAFVSLNGHLPRLTLERWDSLEAVAVFAVLSQAPLVGNLAVQSLGQVRLRSLAETAREAPQEFRRTFVEITWAAAAVALAGTLAAISVGEFVLTSFFGPALAGYGDELAWMLAASLFLYLAGVWGYAWVALGERRLQLPIYAGAVACGLAAAAAWIPTHGLYGAVAAYAVGWAAASAGCLWGVWTRISAKPESGFAPASTARYN